MRVERRDLVAIGVAIVAAIGLMRSPSAQAPAASRAWIARSDENARLLLNARAKWAPEGAARQGLSGFDEQVTQLPPDRRDIIRRDGEILLKELERRRSVEHDPLVAQDLDILIKTSRDGRRGQELQEKYEAPYFNVAALVFEGLRGLLDDQVAPERRRAALVRLRKYAGVEKGFTPLAEQARARMRDWRRPGQLEPAKIALESDLARADVVMRGIPELFTTYRIDGYQEPLERLTRQVAEYNAWLRSDLLPRARTDFRLPPEQYAFVLQQIGVDIAPPQVATLAHRIFTTTQAEMQRLATDIAKARGLSVTDYRDVIRELKKDQLAGDAILPHYQQRLKDIEAIVGRERLVSLPARPARIRLATPAETAQQPAPHMTVPPLVDNTGQQGEFVLPLNVPVRPGSAETMLVDDFTFAAISWTLTAHEARPGHELQFASMIERGVSLARSLFAFNSVNVEGWGLYAEYIMQPFEPAEGQLMTLQMRLLRAARAFIDPELQAGTLTPDDAMRILTTDVVLSSAFANTEVERYTFRSPGQATSYLYGYTKLLELRQEIERTMGARFNQQAFHDFVLSQGLLPPNLLRMAALSRFAAAR